MKEKTILYNIGRMVPLAGAQGSRKTFGGADWQFNKIIEMTKKLDVNRLAVFQE